MTIHQGGEEATSQRRILRSWSGRSHSDARVCEKLRPINKEKNFKNFLEFVIVGVGVPAPVHESYQHDVINGMLCRKMSVSVNSTSETFATLSLTSTLS